METNATGRRNEDLKAPKASIFIRVWTGVRRSDGRMSGYARRWSRAQSGLTVSRGWSLASVVSVAGRRFHGSGNQSRVVFET